MDNITSTPAPLDQITQFITDFGGEHRIYTITANSTTAAILELSGLVDGYFRGDSTNVTGEPLLAGWVLCMVNRRLIRMVDTFDGTGYSFRLLTK